MAGYLGNAPTAVPLTSADITDSTITNADIANSTINLTQKVTGSLPVANGGTGLTALGTASQVLRVNSGATALEFATASSDFVKLASTTASDVASVDLNGYFTADYDVYKIFLEGWYTHQSSNNRIGFRYNTGSYTTQTTNYYSVFDSASFNSGSSGGESGRGVWNSSRADFGFSTSSGNTTAQRRGVIELTLYNPRTTDYYKHSLTSCGAYADGSDYMYKMDGYQVWYDTTAVTGIRFFVPDGGNVTINKIRLYGIKN